MNIKYLQESLDNNDLINNIIYFKTIDSTNDYAKKENLETKTLIFTDEQTKGRGTKQRKWFSESEKNIMMTIYLKPNKNIIEYKNLTIKIAECIKNAINKKYKICLDIKEPNDLLLNNKKICGILTETIVQSEIVKELIIGIGFNVNQEQFNDEIVDIATSLKKETEKEYLREEIVISLCDELEKLLLG